MPVMPSTRSHDALLESALQLIAAGGVESLTLSQVAAHAGVSRATAYREFGDKDGLIGAVARHEIATMLIAVSAEIDPHADPLPLVASVVVAALRYLRNHAAFSYVRDHEPRWLLSAAIGGGSGPNLVQTVASAVAPAVTLDAAGLRIPVHKAAEVMVRTVLSHSLIESSALSDQEVGDAVAYAVAAY
jgi:AcrR family transcriptional regulator